MTTAAKEHGYSVLITTSNDDAETEYIEAERMRRHVDGIAVIPSRSRHARLTKALFGKTPVVVFDRPVSDPEFDVALVQNIAGSFRIVEHLIEHGHRRIAFMGLSRRLFTINARFVGYSRALLRAGIEESAFFGCDSPEDTLRAIKELLARKTPPTAFVTSNTLATLHVFSSLLSLGVKVPSEIAFVGFDDFELAALTAPPLTVVRQPAQGMGRVAAELLFDRIDAGEIPPVGNRIVLPVEMVLRRSCGCKRRSEVVIPLGGCRDFNIKSVSEITDSVFLSYSDRSMSHRYPYWIGVATLMDFRNNSAVLRKRQAPSPKRHRSLVCRSAWLTRCSHLYSAASTVDAPA